MYPGLFFFSVYPPNYIFMLLYVLIVVIMLMPQILLYMGSYFIGMEHSHERVHWEAKLLDRLWIRYYNKKEKVWMRGTCLNTHHQYWRAVRTLNHSLPLTFHQLSEPQYDSGLAKYRIIYRDGCCPSAGLRGPDVLHSAKEVRGSCFASERV